jgi:hypothetical protein
VYQKDGQHTPLLPLVHAYHRVQGYTPVHLHAPQERAARQRGSEREPRKRCQGVGGGQLKVGGQASELLWDRCCLLLLLLLLLSPDWALGRRSGRRAPTCGQQRGHLQQHSRCEGRRLGRLQCSHPFLGGCRRTPAKARPLVGPAAHERCAAARAVPGPGPCCRDC